MVANILYVSAEVSMTTLVLSVLYLSCNNQCFPLCRPRLGPMLHRVVGVGALYFLLACVESYLRITKVKSDRSELLVATIPLAVLDTGICWWIFTSLVQTTRTLRLRR